MRRLSRIAQSTIELSLFLAVAIASFSAMNIYMRRSLQARYRAAVRVFALQHPYNSLIYGSRANRSQYEPYYTREAETHETSVESEREGLPEYAKNTTNTVYSRGARVTWQHTPLPWAWKKDSYDE